MARFMTLVGAAWLAFPLLGIAQTSPPAPPAKPSPPSEEAQAPKVTVTGCLQHAPNPTTAAKDSFILADAHITEASSGAPGAAASESSLPAGGRIIYLDGHQSSLRRRVGEKVEVTGRLGIESGHLQVLSIHRISLSCAA